MIRCARIAAIAASTLLSLSCGSPVEGAHQVASIGVATSGGGPALLTAIGATLALQATLRDSAGHSLTAQVSWSSDAPAVATIDQSGLVTALANGRAVISAAVLGLSSALAVTVEQAAGSVSITPQVHGQV